MGLAMLGTATPHVCCSWFPRSANRPRDACTAGAPRPFSLRTHRAPFLAQLLAFEALSYLASPDRYGPDEPASPVTSVAPVRDQFTDLSGSNANIYTRAGYEPSLMDGGLAMARVGSRHHPNRAWPLRMAGSTLYK